VKLTLKIKLLPSGGQQKALLETIKEANKACNLVSDMAWKEKLFNQFKLHHACYYTLKGSTGLSAQVIVRVLSKVADAYKPDKKTRRRFKPIGSLAYDSRILTYRPGNFVSIWSVDGRLKIPFVCHNPNHLPYIKGEADLAIKKGKYYLLQTVELPEDKLEDVGEFIGCDFGQTDICTLSDGANFNSEQLKKIRKKYTKVRASVQAKGTKSSLRLLKRLSGKERRFVSINNHTIAKHIVAKAKTENKGIAIEDLSHIRKTAKQQSKIQKTELNRWSFNQLRQYLTYKAQLQGVKLFAIPPAYTSKMCSDCLYMGNRKGKRFSCEHCGKVSDADHNAAKNIATWGCLVNQPEKPSILYCTVHYS